MDFTIPAEVNAAVTRLENAGFPTFLVGGCVRDLLRKKAPQDYDLTTAATPEEMKQVFCGERLLETGLRHGTLTLLTEQAGGLEITTHRTEEGYSDGRHPDAVRYSRRIEDDLSRRDFTVNAMAWSPKRGLVDLYGGQEDLQKKCLRCVGDPHKRFEEDALRILRGARFASCPGFSVEPATKQAMLEQASLLQSISVERLATEFEKLLCGENAEEVLLQFREVIAVFIPEIRPCFDFDQRSDYHNLDVYRHICRVVAGVPPQATVRLAAFFHDIEKPRAFFFKNGKGHFRDHPAMSAETCTQVLQRLRFPKRTVQDVSLLVAQHDGVLDIPSPQEAAAVLLQSIPSDLLPALLALMEADAYAKASAEDAVRKVRDIRRALQDLQAKKPCLSVRDLKITGDDLLALGIPKGPQIGATLLRLQKLVFENVLCNEKDALLREAGKECPKNSENRKTQR